MYNHFHFERVIGKWIVVIFKTCDGGTQNHVQALDANEEEAWMDGSISLKIKQ